jgi:hypothetical protein
VRVHAEGVDLGGGEGGHCLAFVREGEGGSYGSGDDEKERLDSEHVCFCIGSKEWNEMGAEHRSTAAESAGRGRGREKEGVPRFTT